MDNEESLTEADDTLDDDCTCEEECDHQYHLSENVWTSSCSPSCSVHGDSVREGEKNATDPEREPRAK